MRLSREFCLRIKEKGEIVARFKRFLSYVCKVFESKRFVHGLFSGRKNASESIALYFGSRSNSKAWIRPRRHVRDEMTPEVLRDRSIADFHRSGGAAACSAARHGRLSSTGVTAKCPHCEGPWTEQRSGERKRWSRPVSRVLYVLRRDSHSSRPRVAAGSSNLPGNDAGRVIVPLFGLAPGGVCRAVRRCPRRGALLPHRFTLTAPCGPFGGLLSVALSVGSRRPGVTWHPALWSPDFPRCTCVRRDCPADSARAIVRSATSQSALRRHAKRVARRAADRGRQLGRLRRRQFRRAAMQTSARPSATRASPSSAAPATTRITNSPAPLIRIACHPRAAGQQGVAEHGFVQLGQFARQARLTLRAEDSRMSARHSSDAMRGFVEHQRARFAGQFAQSLAPRRRFRRQKTFEHETVAGQARDRQRRDRRARARHGAHAQCPPRARRAPDGNRDR